MAKICGVIQIKLNRLVSGNVCMIIDLTNKAYLSAITVTNIYEFLPTRWWQKSTGIDMEQNYVTVALCAVQWLAS